MTDLQPYNIELERVPTPEDSKMEGRILGLYCIGRS